MAEPAMDRDGDTVSVSGEATIVSVADSFSALRKAFARGGAVVVDISGLQRADLSFVQLLISSARTARESGVDFAIVGDMAPLRNAVVGSTDLETLLGQI